MAYSASIYITPKATVTNHFRFPQKPVLPKSREITNVVTGRRNHKNIRLYAIASEGVLISQNTMSANAQIPRYTAINIVNINFFLLLTVFVLSSR